MEDEHDEVIKVNLAALADAIYDSLGTAALGGFSAAIGEMGDIDQAYQAALGGNDDAYEYLFARARGLGIDPSTYCL